MLMTFFFKVELFSRNYLKTNSVLLREYFPTSLQKGFEARKSELKSRKANEFPILAEFNSSPLGLRTLIPFLIQLSAKIISEVITKSFISP